MKIKSITIEGMHNVSEKKYTFDNLNYLYGKNGAGKSTALQAIQLALLGYIPGVEKKNEALARHAKGKTLVVTCVLDDNGKQITLTRSIVGTGKAVTKNLDIEPDTFKIEDILADVELPIYNFTDFLGMTANKMKDWFINFLPNEDSKVDWEKELKAALGDMNLIDDELIPLTLEWISTCSSTGVDLVRDVNAYCKEQSSYLKGSLQRTQSTIQSLVYYDDCEAIESTKQLQEEIASLQSKIMKIAQIDSARQMNAATQAKLAQIKVNGSCVDDDPDIKKLKEEESQLTEQIAIHKQKLVDIDAELGSIQSSINEKKLEQAGLRSSISGKESIVNGGGICPYTKSSCESINTLIDDLKAEIEECNKAIAEIDTQIEKLTREAFALNSTKGDTNLDLQSAQASLMSISGKISNITNQYLQKEMLEKQLVMEELIDGEEISPEECTSRINALQDKLTKAAANEKYNQMIDKLTAEKYKTESTIEAMKLWDKLTGANGLQTTLMVKPFETLAEDMNKYLHKMFNRKDIAAHFYLTDKANSFSFGLMRDDKYITFDMLSSGEKCMYTLSLMMCIMSKSSCPLKVIMIDDLLDHLDDINATKLFESLYKVKDIQIILAGVKECTASFKDEVVIEVK